MEGVVDGAGEKSRTPDLRITNALLYQLSYAGFAAASVACRAKNAILADGWSRPGLHFTVNGWSLRGTAAFFSVAYTGRPPR